MFFHPLIFIEHFAMNVCQDKNACDGHGVDQAFIKVTSE